MLLEVAVARSADLGLKHQGTGTTRYRITPAEGNGSCLLVTARAIGEAYATICVCNTGYEKRKSFIPARFLPQPFIPGTAHKPLAKVLR